MNNIKTINLPLSEVNIYINILIRKTKGIKCPEEFWEKCREAYKVYVEDLKERWVE